MDHSSWSSNYPLRGNVSLCLFPWCKSAEKCEKDFEELLLLYWKCTGKGIPENFSGKILTNGRHLGMSLVEVAFSLPEVYCIILWSCYGDCTKWNERCVRVLPFSKPGSLGTVNQSSRVLLCFYWEAVELAINCTHMFSFSILCSALRKWSRTTEIWTLQELGSFWNTEML